MKINMERSHNFPCLSGEPLLDPGQIQGSGSDLNPEAQKELRGNIHFFMKPSIHARESSPRAVSQGPG